MTATSSLSRQRPQAALVSMDYDADDRRSSSLSDLGDPIGNEELSKDPQVLDGENIEADDTEAETERLEDTPIKARKHQNVILSADCLGPLASQTVAISNTVKSHQDEPTSEISSLEGSSEDDLNQMSSPSSPRKRKRSSLESSSDSIPGTSDNGITFKRPSMRILSPSSTPLKASSHRSDSAIQSDHVIGSGSDSVRQTPNQKPKSKTGKRKGKKIPTDIEEDAEMASNLHDPQIEHGEHGDFNDSNGEDGDREDVGDVDAENASKSEEGVLKKRSALDALTALEKCFATFRDKLFDERLTSANAELAHLQRPEIVHPEVLAMKEAIDRHRDQKIKYQQTLLKYKLQALQKESVATKHQIHGQYMQTVREVRDRSLEQLNKEFYQVQRERRTCEGDVPDFQYVYVDKRTQQITQQTAYNNEISLLSGVAKYVGFPAAPTIQKARTTELEDDMREMGIALHIPRAFQNRSNATGSNLPTTSALSLHTPLVEETFMERNVWANPQHPAHQHQRQQMHRQMSRLSRAPTPSATPTGQRAKIDVTRPQGSASTVPEQPSGHNSSMVPTPATAEQFNAAAHSLNHMSGNRVIDATPSRVTDGFAESGPAGDDLHQWPGASGFLSSATKASRQTSPPIVRHTRTRESGIPGTLPKPLPFTHAVRRASPSNKFPVKIEDAHHPTRNAPTPLRFSSPAPVMAGAGQTT